MAQQKHLVFKWFDEYWGQRTSLAAKVLLEIEDSWLRSDGAFPFKEAAAILLNIFAFDFYRADFLDYRGVRSDDLWHRPLEDWYESVGPPEFECAKLCPKRDEAEYNQLVASLCSILSDAVESWKEHRPNMPSCSEVIQDISDSLIAGRFIILKRG